MDQMKSIKAIMKDLVPMMKGDVTYDALVVQNLAQRLSEKAGSAMTVLFPKGSINGPSEALPSIWQDWERFEASALLLEKSAAQLAATAGNLVDGRDSESWRAFERVVGTCRGCHDDFRKKK